MTASSPRFAILALGALLAASAASGMERPQPAPGDADKIQRYRCTKCGKEIGQNEVQPCTRGHRGSCGMEHWSHEGCSGSTGMIQTIPWTADDPPPPGVEPPVLSRRLTLDVQALPFADLLKTLKDQAGLQFLAPADLLKEAKPVTISGERTVKEILDDACAQAGLSYERTAGGVVALKARPAARAGAAIDMEKLDRGLRILLARVRGGEAYDDLRRDWDIPAGPGGDRVSIILNLERAAAPYDEIAAAAVRAGGAETHRYTGIGGMAVQVPVPAIEGFLAEVTPMPQVKANGVGMSGRVSTNRGTDGIGAAASPGDLIERYLAPVPAVEPSPEQAQEIRRLMADLGRPAAPRQRIGDSASHRARTRLVEIGPPALAALRDAAGLEINMPPDLRSLDAQIAVRQIEEAVQRPLLAEIRALPRAVTEPLARAALEEADRKFRKANGRRARYEASWTYGRCQTLLTQILPPPPPPAPAGP